MAWHKSPSELTNGDPWMVAGKAGRALFWTTGLVCSDDNDSDGLVTVHKLKRAALLAEVSPRAARQIVEAGWWHDADSMCDECLANTEVRPGPGEFYPHRWWKDQISKTAKNDPIAKERQLRRNRLYENKRLCREIRERDRDLCRYCGVRTIWAAPGTRGGDHSSPKSGTYDHVDPFGGNTLDNVVVACRRCNGRKRDRTPEQWVAAGGLELLPPPTSPVAKANRKQPAGLKKQSEKQPAASRSAQDGSGLLRDRPRVASEVAQVEPRFKPGVSASNGNGSNGNGSH